MTFCRSGLGRDDGTEPAGRYEWYIGYVRSKDKPDQGIAVAAMIINQQHQSLHASEMAALMIRDWAHPGPLPQIKHRISKKRRASYAKN